MRVRRICKEYGVVEPVFQEISNGFTVTLFKELLNEGSVLDEEDLTKVSTIEVISVTSGHNDKTSDLKLGDRLGNRLDDRLGDNQKLILETIKNNPTMSITQLRDIVNISQTAIENNIAKLKKNGLLKRVVTPKKGHWEVDSI